MKISKKWKKHLEISSFYTSVPKIMIICNNVLEIWHMTNIIVIFQFGLFFALLPPKKSNFKKMKKTSGDIILHKYYTKNHGYMLYCSWDMVHEECNYFSFWAIFCCFTPPNSLKNENFKKMKNTSGHMIILHKCTKNHDHMTYCFWDMVHDRCNCYFSFWAIFFPFTSQKIKI